MTIHTLSTTCVSACRFDTKMTEVREFVRTKRLPSELAHSVHEFYEHLYDKSLLSSFKTQSDSILAEVPPQLCNRVLEFMFCKTIQSVPLFRGLCPPGAEVCVTRGAGGSCLCGGASHARCLFCSHTRWVTPSRREWVTPWVRILFYTRVKYTHVLTPGERACLNAHDPGALSSSL